MEYIWEELQCFSAGMPKQMIRQFNFVNIAGGTCHDVTPTVLVEDYDTGAIVSEGE